MIWSENIHAIKFPKLKIVELSFLQPNSFPLSKEYCLKRMIDKANNNVD